MENLINEKSKLLKVSFVFMIIACVYLVTLVAGTLKTFGENDQVASVSFSGHGEVNAVPDIANVYFNISKDGKTAKEAQETVALVEKKALDFLKTKNVAEKDIKTANASFNPKYEYRRALCPQVEVSGGESGSTFIPDTSCGNGKQVLVGYSANESITVKIRNVDDVGTIMQGLGATGVSNLNGPNFAIDNEDKLKAEARKKAINDAKEKAEILAKDLGVSLGKILSFNENGGGYPMIYAYDSAMAPVAGKASAPAIIPKGENTLSSDVTITYEIR